ncbi:MAG: DUF4411 family protein [Bacteroidia bacterium]|nr:DUF4411 family protein [Bacteroidia bacterium]MDW8236719.1 DUF4411 family protein [Bacteroidia bacterium]
MKYLLDANVFIQAKNLHYGFDFCPAFWDWLIHKATEQRLYTIDKVAEEIIAVDDDLSNWIKKHYQTLVHPTRAKVVQHLNLIAEWLHQQLYEPAAVSTFMQGADF